jgi:hypothetical protein
MKIGFPKKVPVPIDQSCIGYWKFNEISGNIKDWSGNGNTGILYERYENLLSYSQNFSQSYWSGYCGNKSTFVYNTPDFLAPDGTQTATKIVTPAVINCGVSTGWGVLAYLSPTISPTTQYIVSVWLKGAAGGEYIKLGINDLRYARVTITTSWVRYTYTNTPSTGGRGFECLCDSANKTFYMWGAQVEKTSSVTNYSVTTTTPIDNGIVAYANQYPSPYSQSGKFGTACSFDGTSNYVSIGDIFYSDIFTLSCWVKETVLKTYNNILIKGNSSGITAGDMEWQLISANGVISFLSFGAASSTGLSVVSDITNSVGVWYHVAVVQRGNGNSGYLYINGVQHATAIQANVMTNTASLVQVGVRSNNSDIGYFNGSINEVRIYNRALSAAEIKQHYMRGR